MIHMSALHNSNTHLHSSLSWLCFFPFSTETGLHCPKHSSSFIQTIGQTVQCNITFVLSIFFLCRTSVPIKYLKNVLNTSRTFILGGKIRGSHFTDFTCFALVLSAAALTVGITVYEHLDLVRDRVEAHRREFDTFLDDDPLTQERLVKLMVTNLATYYLAELICAELKKCPVPGISEMRCAFQGWSKYLQKQS